MPKRKAEPGLKVLVTAGPTREWLDPVRFISNPSTGVMGYEIAKSAARRGMAVTLLSGPTHLASPKKIRTLFFESAGDLLALLEREFPKHDVLFMTAAIGDYQPVKRLLSKIKRKSTLAVSFRQTPDLLARVAGRKKWHQTVVGFCLETENLALNAMRKLRSKKLDFIVANYLGKGTRPFGSGKTNVLIIDRKGKPVTFQKISKPRLADKLIHLITR